MDPYEAEEFFKWSEPQRSHLLFVRLKHLEQEMADLKMLLSAEGRTGRPTSPTFMGHQPVIESENGLMRINAKSTPPHPVRRAAMPFSLGTKSLERDLQRQPAPAAHYSPRPASNDRPLYLQKLMQVDNLCKEEMARMAVARQSLEPLNQTASDWKLEGSENVMAADIDGLPERREDLHGSFTDGYLLASNSKMPNLNMTKLNSQIYNSLKLKNFK